MKSEWWCIVFALGIVVGEAGIIWSIAFSDGAMFLVALIAIVSNAVMLWHALKESEKPGPESRSA